MFKKKIGIDALTFAIAAIGMTGCSSSSSSSSKTEVTTQAANKASSEPFSVVCTIFPEYDWVYAQVYDMVNNGDNYLGKTVKAKGPFSYFHESDGREFFAVIISDATACCSQGIEFVLDGDYSYPDDYPAIGTEITVVGKFNYYKEGFYTYCQLTDATMAADET